MYSEAAIASIKTIQAAFGVIALFQLTDHMWPQNTIVNDGASFDFIVVGAGTAGSVVANRLTEDPNTSVLLIEAGGDPPIESDIPATMLLLKRSQSDWNYTSENSDYLAKCHQNAFFEMTLGKVLGGSSSLSYMNYGRGQPRDYDSWAAATNDPTWTWSNVLPYFKKSEKIYDPEILQSPDKDLHGTDGYIGVTKNPYNEVNEILAAFKELGNEIQTDLNANHPLGYSKLMLTIAEGSRQSTAYSYLQPAKDRSNLHVMKNSHVTKILFDNNKNAVGVEINTHDGKTIVASANKEIIISAGVFNTPKLLMLSGIGPKSHLESKGIPVISDVPVGKNLQDHLAVAILHSLDKKEKMKLQTSLHTNPAPPLLGHVALNNSQTHPDYMALSFLIDRNTMLMYCSFAYRYSFKICDGIHEAGSNRNMVINQIVNIQPKSKGEVLLRSSDPADPPIIDTGYFSNENDIEDMIKYVDHFAAVVNTTQFKSMNAQMIDPTECGEHEFGSEEYWRCYSVCMMTGLSHYTSTCAMGLVVDSKLSVYGVQKLRVADASVMPTIPSSHPITSIIMIAEKLADILKEDYV